MSWTHLRDTRPKIRKPRTCVLCGRIIEKGTIAVHRVGKSFGDLYSEYMHVECEALTHDWDEMDWDTFSTGDGEWPEIKKAEGEVV